MNILKIGIVCLLSIIALLWLWGLTLPKTKKVTVERTIYAPIEQVWDVLTNWKAQPNWRRDLRNVEVVNEHQFVEYPLYAPKLTFNITRIEKPNHLEMKMSGFISGTYALQLTADGNNTKAISTEAVTYSSSFQRIINYWFIDLEAIANDYLNDLNEAVAKQ